MDAPTATSVVPEWLRELAAARTRYQELLGGPVLRRWAACRTVPVGMALDGLTMPAPLGARVLAELRS